MPFPSLTPEFACETLSQAGLRVTPEQVQIEARDGRWLVRLPESRLAWFAANREGHERLEKERRVLRLLQDRCRFAAPRILFGGVHDDFDVRSTVPGVCDPARVFAQVQTSVEFAKQIGAAVGAMLADQHSSVHGPDVEGWLPRQLEWPATAEWIRPRLKCVTSDPQLLAGAEDVISKYEALAICEEDRVLVHGDLGFHNMAFDPETLALRGIFDYDSAAWADRHHDFRYLVLDSERCELLHAAISTYEAALHRRIDRGRVFLYNAACAITYLADRSGSGASDRAAGRTLAEDLEWSRKSMAAALR